MPDSVIGKRVLVDVTEYDRDLRIRLSADCLGVVVAVTQTTVQIQRDGTDELVELRANPDSFETAEPGTYRLRSGEPVAAPDLLARWSYYDELPGYGHVELELPLDPGDGVR